MKYHILTMMVYMLLFFFVVVVFKFSGFFIR